MATLFEDRQEAGRQLGAALAPSYAGRGEVLVLALPRGGVPVAFEVARLLQCPLDLLVVRKLGVPGNREFAMGALASGGIVLLDEQVVDGLRISPEAIRETIADEQSELERREAHYRGDAPLPELGDRVVILVDDGLATGWTMRAAIEAVRRHQPRSIVVAVPVAAPEVCQDLRTQVDDILCLRTPTPFQAVGLWYRHFDQTSDAQVRDLLTRRPPDVSTRRK